MKIPASVIQWLEPEQVALPDELRAFCGSDFLAACLVRRGIRTVEQARSFLDPDQYQPASPLDLPDLGKGALRIWQAIQHQECIGVWGDFDVDGQTSTTLLVSVLRQLGGNVIYHIPVRASESHGINLPNLKVLIERGAQVVLTCDTGITAFEAADYCRENNIDLVITDHHTLGLQLPDAFAVINPQRLTENHPLRTIPGVGAAYVFSRELTRLAGRPELADENLDLVALGTVADVATLVQDARYHVQRGLRLLRAPQRAGLRQLYRQALPGILLLHPSVRLAVGASAILYRAILDEIEAIQYNVFQQRAHTTALKKIALLPSILLTINFLKRPKFATTKP